MQQIQLTEILFGTNVNSVPISADIPPLTAVHALESGADRIRAQYAMTFGRETLAISLAFLIYWRRSLEKAWLEGRQRQILPLIGEFWWFLVLTLLSIIGHFASLGVTRHSWRACGLREGKENTIPKAASEA